MPPAAAPISFKQRGRRSKENFRKRPASSATLPMSGSPGDSPSSSDEQDTSEGPRIKRKKKGVVSASTTNTKAPSEDASPTVFRANREMPLSNTNDATKRKDWYDQPAKKGPARAASNVRITTTTDFAPDVCKDYKKTGWCGFGDSCVFVHDRSDMKQGWQLDREWEIHSKQRKDAGSTVEVDARNDKDKTHLDDETMLNNIPFLCIICEEPYKQPVVTQCGHYFCEACALRRYRKDPTCKNCGAATMGVFNAASRLEKLLHRKRDREEKVDG
ncbi:pre-mRNA splicing factor cwc24 [Fusarium albosuccineum]|uniref:Pre-mRNA-splicing factor CWC24 n=1 Tax=Fusarium albosuccineum TaxID=1237068 RepID=A0A8H4KJ36_9HYPO|nr:pre-mRNA splicing factor cwc24 [Fusarium albosuccineum]